MAKLYPQSISHLPEKFNAEKQVFEILKSLDNNYHIFHSVTWTDNRDGECDFIIFDEFKGFITLEVKGGRVEYDGNKWWSTDGNKNKNDITDPIKQSRDAMYAILNTFTEKYKSATPCMYDWAVCFFDGNWTDALVTTDLKEYKVLDGKRSDKVSDWIDNLFKVIEGNHGKKIISKNDAEKFINMFNRKLEIPLSLKRIIIEQERHLAITDIMQDYILDLFEDKTRIGFQGAAGTGKTWIAMKKAKRLSESGKNILFLCYNKPVNIFISDELEDWNNINVSTYHSFATGIVKKFLSNQIINNNCGKDFFKCIGELIKSGQTDNDKNENRKQVKNEKTIEERVGAILFLIEKLPLKLEYIMIIDLYKNIFPDCIITLNRIQRILPSLIIFPVNSTSE